MQNKMTKVAGVGDYYATLLANAGFTSAKKLDRATVEDLCTVPGIGPIRAAQFKEAAKAIVSQKKKKKKAKKLAKKLVKIKSKKKAQKKAKQKKN